MSIAFILIATGGERYTQYLDPLVRSIEEYMPPRSYINIFQEHETFLTTYHQNPTTGRGVNWVPQPDLGWPRATLMRYHAILKQADLWKQYSHVFYMDIDMLVCKHIGDWEICSDGITAVTHPGFPDSFERNPRSTAYVAGVHPYYQGCFVGGKTDSFLSMCDTITRNIDEDDRNGLMAIWHDESHLNRYLIDNPPAKVLSPSYAFPALHYLKEPEKWMNGIHPSQFEPKIRHLEKVDQGKWKNHAG